MVSEVKSTGLNPPHMYQERDTKVSKSHHGKDAAAVTGAYGASLRTLGDLRRGWGTFLERTRE